jgi:glucokinase
MTFFLGIDIGGTGVAGALVSENGKTSHRQELPTPWQEGGMVILQQSMQVARMVLTTSHKSPANQANQLSKNLPGNLDHIHGIGIGTGGQIDTANGTVYSATAVLPGYTGLRIKETFEREFGVRTKVDNDVNVLALGELRFGAAHNYSRNGCVVFLALGTGVGGALLINGELHHGAHWTGGEFGHILLSIEATARKDLGGTRGTLEAYCSGPAMVETYRELTNSQEQLTGEEVVRRATQESDNAARRAVKMTGEYLGYGLVTLVNALDPNLIVIGGGLSELKNALLEPARRILRDYAMPGPAKCPVVPATLGQDAAIVGAASLVISA